MLDSLNTGLNAIPHDDLQTVVDESYVAFAGLGPDLSRLVTGGGRLAADARENLDPLLNLIDRSTPILQAQKDSRTAIGEWSTQVATIGQQVRDSDGAIAQLLQQGPPAVEEARLLLERIQPTVPILAANLASVAPVLVTYQAHLEQLLVLLPQGAAVAQAIVLANRDSPQPYRGAYLSLNLSLNQPPPCTTGFLPAQQQRAAVLEDYPDRPPGYLYCRVPQDSSLGVRGLRNLPCVTRPGKRAPTVAMCESDEVYVPLNDGYNWKGDPNATVSGQPVPQPPTVPSEPTPVAAAEYDPATGMYTGPDGQVHRQGDLVGGASGDRPWQSMLVPPSRPVRASG